LRWGESYLDKALGTDADVQRAQSPSNLADRIQAPVWLVHGDEDQRAPIEHAENMLEALKAADATVEYTVLEGGGHGIFDEQQRIEFYDALLKFLESHLND
jgi:dipeptidyl aminopeptidase/acylaminoacyl peptidase